MSSRQQQQQQQQQNNVPRSNGQQPGYHQKTLQVSAPSFYLWITTSILLAESSKLIFGFIYVFYFMASIRPLKSVLVNGVIEHRIKYSEYRGLAGEASRVNQDGGRGGTFSLSSEDQN